MCWIEKSGCDLYLPILQGFSSCRFTPFLLPHDSITVGKSSVLDDFLRSQCMPEAINCFLK